MFEDLTMSSVLLVASAGMAAYLAYKKYFADPSPPIRPPGLNDKKTEYVEDGRPKLTILYGSQTGTAEGFTKTLAQEGNDVGFNVKIMNLADFTDYDELQKISLLMLVIATYGEGEPTDDARDFYEHIVDEEKKLTEGSLSNLKFTIFSLGNRQYKHYQAMGRLFDKRFEELGAQRVYKRGEGDADATIEEDFEDWKTQVWEALAKEFNVNAGADKPIVKSFNIEYHNNIAIPPPFVDPARGTGEESKRPFLGTILVNRELLNTTERSTRHVEVSITGSRMRYEAGDHLGVYAANDSSLVEEYARRLGVYEKLDHVFSLKHIKGQNSVFPGKCSIRTAFTHYLDLQGLPRKPLLRACAMYASDETEKARLSLLAKNDDEGKAEYLNHIKTNCLTALDILDEFKSVTIPIEHFMELTPRLQPRYYSIASSSRMNPHSIHACVAVVKYETPRKVVRNGLCSTFLQNAHVNDKVYVFVRQSNFHLPLRTTTPVIMVGPGTGLAPFVGFLQQRRALKEKEQREMGECHLFFGCRKQSEDFIYQEDMQKAVADGVITKLHVAFSRDQGQKVYVQHKITEQEEAVYRILSSGGVLYICGDAKYMAKDVERTLVQIIMKHSKGTKEEAEAFMEKLQVDRKYLKDVWSP